jgi:hypothetical protein
MSKKNKRQTRRAGNSVGEAAPVAAISSATRSGDRDFKPDYSYVIKDLKRIGLLAGTFFAILIVLSFFLN